MHSGKNVVVGDADGIRQDTLLQLPVLNALLENPDARALLPISRPKALAQDQLAELHDLSSGWMTALVINLRRRHPERRAQAIRERRTRCPDKSGHVAHGNFAAPHQLDSAVLRTCGTSCSMSLHTYRGVFGSHFSGMCCGD